MPAADEDNSNAADVMRYPAAVTAEDCRAAAAVVVQWLVETAAEPGERCKVGAGLTLCILGITSLIHSCQPYHNRRQYSSIGASKATF